MPKQPLFAGLIFDELDRPVEVAYVGDEPCYVVDDQDFRRHIPSEQVDRQVLDSMHALIQDHEDIIADQTARMLGQEDPFSKAMIESQLKNIEDQFDALLQVGLPEEARAYLGMLGFKIRINVHGDVLEVEQPGMSGVGDEGEE
jgi:hypothetical protein